jgi:hypothetical protein
MLGAARFAEDGAAPGDGPAVDELVVGPLQFGEVEHGDGRQRLDVEVLAFQVQEQWVPSILIEKDLPAFLASTKLLAQRAGQLVSNIL